VDTGCTILAIDDNPTSLQMLVTILKERGHKVRAVTSGQMGITVARTILPDLILLDVTMPQADGYHICRLLKADEELQHIPVIFISALDETLDKVEAFQSGGIDYITKPFQIEEVILRVENQLKLHRFYLQSLELAKMEERQRIARDLHDAVSQTLFSTGILAETLLMSTEDEKTAKGLQRIYQLTQGALAEMRTLLLELRPEAMEKTELGELLHHLADMMIARTPAEVTAHINEHIVLDAEVKTAFYRIAQEALNNVLKHARASSIIIELSQHNGTTMLRISDNGSGFDPAHVPHGHFGLSFMAERAQLIGAELFVNGKKNHGTDVILTYRDTEE
jgi:two-component system sensor histidine kinase/response regulator